MSDENKRLVREITEVLWNKRALDRIPEFYAPDFLADRLDAGRSGWAVGGTRGPTADIGHERSFRRSPW